MLHVEQLEKSHLGLKPFLDLPYRLYRKDKNWVPPLYDEQRRSLLGENNPLLADEHQFFMAYQDDRPVARVLAGVDTRLNERLNEKRGYISLFECEHNVESARAVLDAACEYLKDQGMTRIVGPCAATFNDFGKGLLSDGFDGLPAIFNPYNPPYYNEFFLECGFQKYRDHYAYHLNLDSFAADEYRALSIRAQKRFSYTLRTVDFRRADKERLSADVAQVIKEAFPSDWELVPPTKRDIHDEIRSMQRIADSANVVMAYAGQRPIGVLTAFPDYNPIFRRNRGRLFPFGWLTILLRRRQIHAARCNMLFVSPDYQNKAVGVAMIQEAYQNAIRLGLTEIEASTIDETNVRSLLLTERTGAVRYRVYRQYIKEI